MNRLTEREAGRPSRFRLWLMLLTLGIAYFFSNFHRLSLGVLGSVMAEDFGLSAAQLGLLGSAFFYAYAAMQIPGGLISDRIGGKYVIAGSCLITAIGTIWFSMAESVSGLAAARAITGLAVAFVYVPALASLRSWFGDASLGTMTGILVAMGQVGAVCASAPLKLISDTAGWRNAFSMIGYVSLVLCAAAWLFVLNRPASAADNGGEKKESGSWKAAFRPAAFSIAVWFFITGGTRLAFQSLWGSQYFTVYLKNTPLQASANLMWISVGCIFGAMVLGRICDRLGSIRTLVLSSFLLAFLWMGMTFLSPGTPDALVAFLCMMLGVLGAGSFTVGFACVREFAENGNTGLLTGINNCVGFLGTAVFTQLSGSFVSLFSNMGERAGFFFLTGAFALLCAGVTFLVFALNKDKVFLSAMKAGREAA